jgi:hypothetical protein
LILIKFLALMNSTKDMENTLRLHKSKKKQSA